MPKKKKKKTSKRTILKALLRNAFEDEMDLAINASASSENYTTNEEIETSGG